MFLYTLKVSYIRCWPSKEVPGNTRRVFAYWATFTAENEFHRKTYDYYSAERKYQWLITTSLHHRLEHLLSLIRETSLCSRWQLTETHSWLRCREKDTEKYSALNDPLQRLRGHCEDGVSAEWQSWLWATLVRQPFMNTQTLSSCERVPKICQGHPDTVPALEREIGEGPCSS